jgi:endonuclease G, mitochondrial
MVNASKGLVQMGVLMGLSALLSACDLLLVASTQVPLPPCVNDDCNCGDFNSRALAQQVLEAFPGDPYKLDSDGNGQACESLPPQAVPFDPPGVPSQNLHLLLGNPSNANATNPNNYLLERQQYALGYGRDRNLAHWVSWHLDASWLGSTPRQDNFRPDGALPTGFYQVTPDDYRGSGYDRGHLLPSADRTANARDNAATFLMTNIVPQVPEHNRGIWRVLEEYERDLVYQYDRELYIIAGAYGTQGTIGQRQKIAVPSRLWKVIVVMDQPGSGLNGISETTQVIAVDMPNRKISGDDWQRYQTSIDSIELATGLDLLSNVPEAVQAALESRVSGE